MHQYGVDHVRGVEVEGFLDDEGRVIEDWIEKPHFTGNQRTLRVWLDTNQYHSGLSENFEIFLDLRIQKPQNDFPQIPHLNP